MRPQILFPLFAPATSLKGVGPRLAPLLEKTVGGPLVRDLLFHAPHGLIRREPARIEEVSEGQVATLELVIEAVGKPGRRGRPWRVRASDETGWITLVWFNSLPGGRAEILRPGARLAASGRIDADRFAGGLMMVHPDWLVPLERMAEIPRQEPVYPLTAGLTQKQLRRAISAALDRLAELPEWQDGPWLAARGWPSWREAVERLHAPASEADLSPLAPHRARLAFDELLAHQLALGRRREGARERPGPAILRSAISRDLEAALPFALTGAQKRVLEEIRGDLAGGRRMTRLLQGDVGSGKTVIAMLVIADAAAAGWQSALMAPTEILARQHYETLNGPLAARAIATVLLSGRDKGAQRAEKLTRLAGGQAKAVVGTHALFQDEVAFADLGLTIVDEQHRFGVGERARLKAKGESAHLLALSATPIPRTLELTLFGDLDISRLDEKPPGRTPVATRAVPSTRIGEMVDRLARAIAEGRQAYWVCPLIGESETADLAAAEARKAALAEKFGATVGLIHGRLPAAEKDRIMSAFVEGRTKILVATTVVEVGVDAPNATIMVIEGAEHFGLAQLHQLRGRVGRGAEPSSCVILYDPPLSEAAQARLDILRRTDDGFVIAEKDLELRGGGDPLGLRQSGFPDWRLADPFAHRGLIVAAADHARLMLRREAAQRPSEPARVLAALFEKFGEERLAAAG
ncbi:MAG: ATP-dependent DNA helicase RecG [Caulobacteraceae bacterium]